ncbi:MAG: Sjogren's syndrome/scleroderma autoantigen 1 family protein [Candidatus Bathyarchaeia archaeon]
MSSELKRMSELLKSGATMLSEACPECGSPLFKVGSDIICAKCNKPVVILKAAEEEDRVLGDRVLGELEQTIMGKIKDISRAIDSENDMEKLTLYGRMLSTWLDALDRIKKLKPD